MRGRFVATLAVAALAGCTMDAHLGYSQSEVDQAPPDTASADAGGAPGDAATASALVDEAGYCEQTQSSPPPSCQFADGLELPEVFALDPGTRVHYLAGGAALPPGRYRVEYVGGCRRMELTDPDPFPWTVHTLGLDDKAPSELLAIGGASIFLVDEAMAWVAFLPGTGGITERTGAFSSYESCVAANCGRPASEFNFVGGPLGVQPDLLAAMLSAPNNAGFPLPTFRLVYLEPCDQS